MKKSFLLALLATVTMPLYANAETIFDALSNTYKTNHTLIGQRAYLRSVDENVAIAKSGYRPNVYLQGSYAEGNTDNNNLINDYDYTNKGISAKVNQPIFSGFQTVNSVRSADSTVKAEQYNLLSVEQQVMLNAASAYLDVVRDMAIVDLQKNQEKLLKKRLDEIVERFNVGEVTRTDVAQSRARYSKAQSDRIAAEGNLEASKALYNNVIGHAATSVSEPKEIRNFLPKNFDEAMNYAIANNYSIKQAKNNLKAKTYDVATKTGALLPSVGLNGTASDSKNNSEWWVNQDGKTKNYEVSADMTVPLYDAGADRARIRQSKYQKWQAQEQVLGAQGNVAELVKSSWEYMSGNDAKIKSIGDQVKANEIALDGVQKEESLGNRTVLDVLDAYQELLNSNVEEVKARRDYYVSAMQLLLSMGKLTAKDLNLNVEFYNAKKHSKDTRNKWLSIGIDKDE